MSYLQRSVEREAAAGLGTVEVLPGRYDAMLVAADAATAGPQTQRASPS